MKQATLDQMFAKSKRSTRNNPQEEPKLELPPVLSPNLIQQPNEQVKSDQALKPTKKLHHNTIKAMERKRIEEQEKKQRQRLGIIQEEQEPERQRSRGKKGRPPKIKKIIQEQKKNSSQNINFQNNQISHNPISKQQQLPELSEVKSKRRGRQPKNKEQKSEVNQKKQGLFEQIQQKPNSQAVKLQIQPIQIRIQLNFNKPNRTKKTTTALKDKPIQENKLIHNQQHLKMDQQPLEYCVQQKKRQVKKVIKKGLKIQQKSEFTLYNKYFNTLIQVDKKQNDINKVLDRPLIFDKFRHNNQYQQLLTAINQK